MKDTKSPIVAPKNVLIVMLIIITTLIVTTLFTQWLQLQYQFDQNSTPYEVLQRFDVDEEISILTWYSQTTILLAAILAVCIGLKVNIKDRSRWVSLGAVLAFMSLDEGASLHELFARSVRI